MSCSLTICKNFTSGSWWIQNCINFQGNTGFYIIHVYTSNTYTCCHIVMSKIQYAVVIQATTAIQKHQIIVSLLNEANRPLFHWFRAIYTGSVRLQFQVFNQLHSKRSKCEMHASYDSAYYFMCRLINFNRNFGVHYQTKITFENKVVSLMKKQF